MKVVAKNRKRVSVHVQYYVYIWIDEKVCIPFKQERYLTINSVQVLKIKNVACHDVRYGVRFKCSKLTSHLVHHNMNKRDEVKKRSTQKDKPSNQRFYQELTLRQADMGSKFVQVYFHS